MMLALSPKTSTDVARDIEANGFSFCNARTTSWSGGEADWVEFAATWADLVEDRYTPQPYVYRSRRFGEFQLDALTNEATLLPKRTFDQRSEAAQRLYGNLVRQFAPLAGPFVADQLRRIIANDLLCFRADNRTESHWIVGVHQLRVIGRFDAPGIPTPEGIHSDGYRFVATHLMNFSNGTGGTSTVFAGDGSALASAQLLTPWDSLFLDDRRVQHFVSPVSAEVGIVVRDVLVIGYELTS